MVSAGVFSLTKTSSSTSSMEASVGTSLAFCALVLFIGVKFVRLVRRLNSSASSAAILSEADNWKDACMADSGRFGTCSLVIV